VSSGAVYGDQPSDLPRVPEHFAGQPDPSQIESTYGLGKRAAERLCIEAADSGGPPPVIARCFAFAGPHLPLDAHFAFGNFLRDGLAGRRISVAGDGTAVRSYLYGTDLAEWLLTLLVKGEARAAYNVGSDEPVSIADLAAAVGDHFGAPVNIARAADPGAPRRRYVPNTSCAQALGLRANVSLPEAIARSAAFHRARGL
jgi:dTDP-glucose 4,6-dehydratase